MVPAMRKTSRRQFLSQLTASAIVFPRGRAAASQVNAPPSYDLLIAGGHVIDPSQKLSAERDIAISGNQIARLAVNIPRNQALDVLDARGKIVTPGLIDMHGHVFDGVRTAIDPDRVGIPRGVTTIVDGGSAGALTFPAFRKHVIERVDTRIYSILSLSTIGLVVSPGNEFYVDPRLIDPKATIRMIERNRDRILGIKARISGGPETAARDVEIMQLAREAGDATGVPIMMHWCNDPKPLALLKRGDIMTHPFNPPRAGPNLLGEDDKVLPQILALRERGIFTDFSHGGHLLWTVAEKAAAQGWFPDVISTDINQIHAGPGGHVVDLVTTMAKFMYLGLTLEQVVERVTVNPARILKFPEKLGTLEQGAAADVTVLDLVQADVELRDSTGEKRIGRQRLAPVATVKAGKQLMRA
jgi:dihydroorotase